MAKLYWRVLVDGKWTWKAATNDNTIIISPAVEAVMMHEGPENAWVELNYNNPEAEEE